jgi:hypothetical protein
MHASGRRVGVTYAILAAIFIATAVCVFVLVARVAPRAPAQPRGEFKTAATAPAPAHPRHITHLAPHESAQTAAQLTPMSVHCRISKEFPLGEPREVTLTLEKGDRGEAVDLDNPRPCSAEPRTIKLGTNVSASLLGPPDVVKFAPLEEKHYTVTPAAPVKWTWFVTPLKPGTYEAQIVVSTELTIAGKAENIQVWTPPLRIHVDAGVFGWADYVIDWVGSKPLVSSLASALVITLGAAIAGHLRGWFGFLFRRKPAQDAPSPT